MKRVLLISAMVLAAPALAESGATDEVRGALEDQAHAPAVPPTLPDAAADRARTVHQTVAFGQKGAAERAAHSQADQHGRDAAKQAHADAASRAAQAAAARAEHTAASESRDAASQSRSNDARTGTVPRPPNRGGQR